MAISKLTFKAGMNKDQTNYASEGGWYDMDKARFRSGFPEKIGGWTVATSSDYVGVARSLFPWYTADGGLPIGIGTNEKMYVSMGSILYDITPLRLTLNHASTPSTDNCITVNDGSANVTFTLNPSNVAEGDWVTVSGVVGTLGGIPAASFNQEFKVFNVNDIAGTFQVTVDTQATSNATGVGGTAIVVEFQISTGNAKVTAGYGWGVGPWSRGTWGSGYPVPIFQSARIIFQDNFNDNLVFNINNGGPIYYWPYNAVTVVRAELLSAVSGAIAVPQAVNKIQFTSQGFLVGLGCTTYDPTAPAPDYAGPFDPLMIRWSNVDPDIGPDPLNWEPQLTNTAGYLRIQSGSRIITSIGTRQETLVWTDTSLNSFQYLGTAEVFGLQQLSAHTTIIGPNAVIGANNITYWMGNDKFYTYSGRVDTLPCTLRQFIFQDINRTQGELVFAGSNVQFNEVVWFYCTLGSDEINRYVIYNYSENLWYYGNLERTAWQDAGVTGFPIAADNGWVYNHEDGTDDGQPNGEPALPISSFIQSADVDIGDGDKFMLIRRIIPDVNFNGSTVSSAITPQAIITVGVRNFPGAANATTNASGETNARDIVTATATIDQYTNQIFVRARGRQMNFRIESATIGTQWQLGMPRMDAREDGKRG